MTDDDTFSILRAQRDELEVQAREWFEPDDQEALEHVMRAIQSSTWLPTQIARAPGTAAYAARCVSNAPADWPDDKMLAGLALAELSNADDWLDSDEIQATRHVEAARGALFAAHVHVRVEWTRGPDVAQAHYSAIEEAKALRVEPAADAKRSKHAGQLAAFAKVWNENRDKPYKVTLGILAKHFLTRDKKSGQLVPRSEKTLANWISQARRKGLID